MPSLTTGTVVKTTRMAKMNVQMGSASFKSGLKKMIKDAITTPMLWTVSPKKKINKYNWLI